MTTETKAQPFTSSPVVIIEGKPRSGKTNTAVAMVVDAYKEDSETKIFANFHLKGIKYVFTTLYDIISLLNSPVLRDGYIILDEAYIGGDAREGMSLLNRLLTWFGMQAGKRRLYLYIIVQHGRMIDWRHKWLMGRHMFCTYNPKTKMITLDITEIDPTGKRANRNREVTYDASRYWRYFDTEEVVQIPDAKIAKALERG